MFILGIDAELVEQIMEYEKIRPVLFNYLLMYIFFLGIIIESVYQKIKTLIRKDLREKFRIENEIIPIVVAGLIIIIMHPSSVFWFLPFYPENVVMDFIFSAVILSRMANLSHEGIKSGRSLFERLINLVSRR